MLSFFIQLTTCVDNEHALNGDCRNVDALISAKQRPDANLAEETERCWIEIVDRKFMFDRMEQEVCSDL